MLHSLLLKPVIPPGSSLLPDWNSTFLRGKKEKKVKYKKRRFEDRTSTILVKCNRGGISTRPERGTYEGLDVPFQNSGNRPPKSTVPAQPRVARTVARFPRKSQPISRDFSRTENFCNSRVVTTRERGKGKNRVPNPMHTITQRLKIKIYALISYIFRRFTQHRKKYKTKIN